MLSLSLSDICFSQQIPLGLIFKNENNNKDMLAILQMFHTYLPESSDAAIGVDKQLFSSDQLTVERAVNVIASVANPNTTGLLGWDSLATRGLACLSEIAVCKSPYLCI